MIAHVKKVLVVLIIALAIPTIFSGCNKKPAHKACKSDADCRVDASGNPQNGVCHMGKCEECVENTDCTGLKQCVNNRCESTCEVDADCGLGKHCTNKICMNDCTSNESCGVGMVCARGRCLSQVMMEESQQCQGIAHFDFDRFDIKESEKEKIEKSITCLEANPGSTLLIAGHTDVKGTPSYNEALGERRAMSVKNYMQARGIESNRLSTVSYGDKRPMVDEQNEHAWQQNRRAECKYSPAN